MNQYISQQDAQFWSKLYSEPPAIVAACNKVQRRYERSVAREWWKGLAVALSAVVGALAIAWVVTLWV